MVGKMTEEKPLSEEEKKQLSEYFGFGAPIPEEKHNVHSFLHKVATAEDTTKVGYLSEDELGAPSRNLRSYKEMSLIASKIMDNKELGEYYQAKGEIITSTSLSKNAKLINLAVIQKRIIEDETKERKENKGWFKKKNPEEDRLNA